GDGQSPALPMIRAVTVLTVFAGIAKPTPSLPPDWLAICALTPITSPAESSSGPPELPWLIAASVWIAPAIVALLGAWMLRPVALTMPAVSDSCRPNGLPMAYTASPTATRDEFPNDSGCSRLLGTFTRSTA